MSRTGMMCCTGMTRGIWQKHLLSCWEEFHQVELAGRNLEQTIKPDSWLMDCTAMSCLLSKMCLSMMLIQLLD